MSRYSKFTIIPTESFFYKKQLDRRGVKRINHYALRTFSSLPDEIKRRLTITKSVWTAGTTLAKVSNDVYGNQDFWWVIGYYNNKPIDADWTVGDEILIPTPLQTILRALDVT